MRIDRQLSRSPLVWCAASLVILAAAVVGIRAFLRWEECSRACPSDRSIAFASQIRSSDDFRIAFNQHSGSAIEIGFLGPAALDPVIHIAVAGVTLNRHVNAAGERATGKLELGSGRSAANGWANCYLALERVEPLFYHIFQEQLGHKDFAALPQGRIQLVLAGAACL